MTTGPRGLIAASHSLAAEAGAAVLRTGGNAIDAAAAVQFALNVVEPLASGLGGGAFSLVRLANGEMTIVDSRERAPAAASPEQFLGPDLQPIPDVARYGSALSVGVPGALLGQVAMLERWGSRSLSEVLRPAIALAEQEIPASDFLASRLAEPDTQCRVAADPASAATFLPAGQPLATGQPFAQPDLARTLRLIAERGPDVFYRGEIARALVDVVAERGGRLTLDDLEAYRVELRRPLLGRYRQFQVATMPPPGSGFVLLQMLGLVETLDLATLPPLSAPRLHLELQVMRLALADRAAYLGDPAYTSIPLDQLLSPAYLAERRSLISPARLGPAPAPGTPTPGAAPESTPDDRASGESGDTTHFIVVDRWGNLVSCTSTIEELFGSGITVPGYGFLLNDQLADFDAAPGGPNQVRPGARPASSMVPTLLLHHGRPFLTLGSPGGPTIVTAVFQVLTRLLDDGWSLTRAVDAPRLFASRYPRFTWEPGVPESLLAELRALGHRPARRPRSIGSVQAVLFDDQGQPLGAADPRRDGAVVVIS